MEGPSYLLRQVSLGSAWVVGHCNEYIHNKNCIKHVKVYIISIGDISTYIYNIFILYTYTHIYSI